MKRFTNIVIVGLILMVAVVGCRKRPGYLTPLPGAKAGSVQDPSMAGQLGTGSEGLNTSNLAEGVPFGDPSKYDGWNENAEIFRNNTVYFAFDSSAVQGSERAKVAAVADYLKANNSAPRTAIRVEGHCDERGTEEYNRALGERRALAVREELISQGVDPNRVVTVSYGEDRPAATGSGESVWRQNRRGEFILLTEP
jgi:peptidoglycan-associated lipoprotein